MTAAGKALRLLLGLAVALGFSFLLLRHVDLERTGAALRAAHPLALVAALVAFLTGYACRVERWRIMLVTDHATLRWRACAGPFFASFAVNNVLPLRAGDLLRATGFSGRLGVSSGTVIASMFIERLLDLLMLLVFLALALRWSQIQANALTSFGPGTLLATSVVIALTLLQPQRIAPLLFAAAAALGRVAPHLGTRMNTEMIKGFAALDHVRRAHTMSRLLAWSALAWLCEGAVFWLAAQSLPSLGHAGAAWLAFPVGTLATLIPSTPGYLGTFDYFAVHAMTLLGNSPSAAAAFALLVHALLWVPPTVIGGAYLLLLLRGRKVPAATQSR